MKKVKITSRDQPTTDYGTLLNGNEYEVSDQLADFLLKRGFAELVKTPAKKAVKKKAAKK
jgi:hypothetical protein